MPRPSLRELCAGFKTQPSYIRFGQYAVNTLDLRGADADHLFYERDYNKAVNQLLELYDRYQWPL